MPKCLPFHEVAARLRYEPETGRLFWRKRTPSMFSDGGKKAAHTCACFNSIYAEREALTSINNNGYRHGSVARQKYLAHRVAWLLTTGNWPLQAIDHINGVRSDNRIVNLREATAAQNAYNTSSRSNSSSRFLGVSWNAQAMKWRAQIKINGKNKFLGHFADEADAASAYDDFAAAHRGEFASTNFPQTEGLG